jgi:hypothetical protein
LVAATLVGQNGFVVDILLCDRSEAAIDVGRTLVVLVVVLVVIQAAGTPIAGDQLHVADPDQKGGLEQKGVRYTPELDNVGENLHQPAGLEKLLVADHAAVRQRVVGSLTLVLQHLSGSYGRLDLAKRSDLTSD